MYKEIIKYLKDNPKGYWFKSKLYGYGWTPAKWQGWLVLFLFLALIFLIWGGIQWTMSGGDKEGIQKARLKLTYAIIGLVVTTLAFFIVNIISGFFGFNFFTLCTISLMQPNTFL